MKISVIIPCYNEEQNINPFFKECLEVLKYNNYQFEYIFINDGSTDNTLKELKKLITNYPNSEINIINFSRNFGKEGAMLAGLKNCQGDYAVFIDSDLQQDPKYIVQMLKILENNSNYDSVACYQEKRKENKFISFSKRMFYKTINNLSDTYFYHNASDFRCINRKMINALIELKEYFRFSKGIFSWIGFNTYYMPYQVRERLHGKTHWSMKSLIKYAINGITNFSTAPLKFATKIGIISFVLSIIYGIVIIIQKIFIGINISGYATIVCLILLFGGLQMIFLGIIGEYLGKTYIETKKRPLYIIKDQIKTGAAKNAINQKI